MSNRIESLDFVRTACTIGVVLTHFAAETGNSFLERYLCTFPAGNGSVGSTLVTVFFLISGGLLYHNHRSVDNLRLFYSNRALAIYPSFYLAWCASFIVMSLYKSDYFAGCSPMTFPLTVLAFDGYLGKVFRTWYLLGEWFLGAIVLCYLAYPLLLKAVEKNEWATLIISSALFFLTSSWSMFNQDPFRNVFSCLFSFLVGMLIFKYELYNSGLLAASGIVLSLVLYFLPLPLPGSIGHHLCGFSLFFALNAFGRAIVVWPVAARLTRWAGAVSYEIFLVHHLVLYAIMAAVPPNDAASLTVSLVLTLVFTLGSAYLLNKASREAVRRVKTLEKKAT